MQCFMLEHVVLCVFTNFVLQAPLTSNTLFLNRLTNKQDKLDCRTCAERAKLKMRTVHANTDPNHDLAYELVPEIGSCTARARPTRLAC